MFKSSFIAGCFIGIAALLYASDPCIATACLFSFGLLAVVHWQTPLFTGLAGFVSGPLELAKLFMIVLPANVLGTFAIAPLADVATTAEAFAYARITTPIPLIFHKAVACGVLMTTAVHFARKSQYLPLLFAVPTFILCGFYHSIADAAYYIFCSTDFIVLYGVNILTTWLVTVFGNFVGCNISRLLSL